VGECAAIIAPRQFSQKTAIFSDFLTSLCYASPMKAKKERTVFHKLCKLSGLMLLTATAACNSVSYVPNAALRENYLVSAYDEDSIKSAQKFGAIRLISSPAAGSDEEPSEQVFLLKRTGKSYMAETMLADNTGDENSVFDKAFLGFGTDRNDRSVGFTLRFVY
jgi:hypothetical protein